MSGLSLLLPDAFNEEMALRWLIYLFAFKKQKSSSSTKLLDVARTFAINNFTEVVQDTNFYQIPLEELESIVQQSTLNIKSEEDVFTAVIKWIKADEVRKKSTLTLYRLLQHVRLPLAKPQFLLDVVQIEPLIKQNRFVNFNSRLPGGTKNLQNSRDQKSWYSTRVVQAKKWNFKKG